MKRLLFIVFGLVSAYAHGQNTYAYTQANNKAFSIGLEGTVPVRDVFFYPGGGGSLKGEYPLGENISLTVTGGYTAFSVKKAYKEPDSANPWGAFIPVKAGIKYFIGDGLYFEGEVGATIETNYEKRKYGNISVGTGYMMELTKRSSIDFSARYEDWGSSAIRLGAIRVAYRADWL